MNKYFRLQTSDPHVMRYIFVNGKTRACTFFEVNDMDGTTGSVSGTAADEKNKATGFAWTLVMDIPGMKEPHPYKLKDSDIVYISEEEYLRAVCLL